MNRTTPPVLDYTTIEDFEDGTGENSLSNNSINWDGNSSRPEYDTDWAADGSLSVEIAGNGFSVYNYSRPGDGLPTYPANDCTYRVAAYQVTDSSSGLFRLWWGMDSADTDPNTNSYKLEGGPQADDGSSTGNTAVVKYSGGSKTLLAESSTILTERNLYDVAVTFRETNDEAVSDIAIYQWDDGNSEWTQYLSLTATDTAGDNLNQGGIAFGSDNHGNNSEYTYFDLFRTVSTPGGHTDTPQYTPPIYPAVSA
ncbi:hypothetical protein [Halorubrum sp. HHNYT27]|uniref:hypothetical protein n=1 Tax=Halorubrum sp. HHNYT27 TaxID=3402275 RepID=UPI003EBC01A3